MTTPIEDRLAALEAWRATVDPALTQIQQAIVNLRSRVTALETSVTAAGPRLTTLEANYADAVKRFQKAERMTGRLRVILRILWMSTAGNRAGYLSSLDPAQREQAAIDLESVDAIEHINRREDPDEWQEPAAG